MSTCFRFVNDEGEVQERFYELTRLKETDANTIVKEGVLPTSEQFASLSTLLALGADGASVMSGCYEGVAAKLKRSYPWLLYVHCAAHRLNLIVVEYFRTVKSASNVIKIYKSLHAIFNVASHREIFEATQRDIHPKEHIMAALSLTEVRWACKSEPAKLFYYQIEIPLVCQLRHQDICILLHKFHGLLISVNTARKLNSFDNTSSLNINRTYQLTKSDIVTPPLIPPKAYGSKRRRIRYQKKPVTYYSNSVATRRLLLSGDVEENPGPLRDQNKQNKQSKPSKPAKCPQCTRSVQSNHKRYLCTVCYDLYHAKCSTLSTCTIKNVRAAEPQEWICDKCHLSTLPFYQCTQDEFIANHEPSTHNITHNSSNDLRQDEHSDALNSRPNQLKIIHLNTQSMVSTFDELLVTVEEYPFDIIAMSETWLKDNPHLLNYVTIPGYSQVFRNREKIRGGGVGFYVREGIMFKRRMDIENVEPDLEHIWLEVDGRNRHSKMLLGVIYRSESMDNFSSWIEKIENLLRRTFGADF